MDIPAIVRPLGDSLGLSNSPGEESMRWQQQGLGYRILHERHKEDVRQEIRETFAEEVADNLVFHPDLSRNPLKLLVGEMNVLYSDPPGVLSDAPDEALTPILPPTIWPIAQSRQAVVQAVGECLTGLSWDETTGRVRYRVVPPHTVVITASVDDPTRPVRIAEIRARYYGGKWIWAWDVWDITDPANPTFTILKIGDTGPDADITMEVLGSLDYPYRRADGTGILPYSLHHLHVQDHLWDWQGSIGLTSGTLRVAALWSHWCDGFVSSAHPQRVAIDLETPAGQTKVVNGVPVTVVPVDRTGVLLFKSTSSDKTGTISSLEPALKPLESVSALQRYEEGLAMYAGLSPADLQVTTGQSGYAIVLSREGKRNARRQQIPAAKMGDQVMLATAAAIANSRMGTTLPENPEDYQIRYHDLMADATEIRQRVDLAKAQLDAGIISEIEALMVVNPDLTEDQAIEEFQRSTRLRGIAERERAATLVVPISE